tara:strand:+ start:790 stop:996 length:207 start_codon:yes stop_codon:yes gene_type:complete
MDNSDDDVIWDIKNEMPSNEFPIKRCMRCDHRILTSDSHYEEDDLLCYNCKRINTENEPWNKPAIEED